MSAAAFFSRTAGFSKAFFREIPLVGCGRRKKWLACCKARALVRIPEPGAAACPAPPKARPKSSAGRAPFPQGHAAGTARSSQVSDPLAPTGRPAPAVPGQPLHTPHTERIKEHSPRAPCRSAQARNGAAQRPVPRPARRTHKQGGDGPPRAARRAGRRHSLRLPRGSQAAAAALSPSQKWHTPRL